VSPFAGVKIKTLAFVGAGVRGATEVGLLVLPDAAVAG
jgi:hypothetical protein